MPRPPRETLDILLGRESVPDRGPRGRAFDAAYAALAAEAEAAWQEKPPCAHCGCRCAGVEPIWPLKVAAEIIPFSTVHALTTWLHDHKDDMPPATIRKFGHTKIRMLSQTEILRIRE